MKTVVIFRHATAIGGAERYLLNLVKESKDRVNYVVITNSAELAGLLKEIGIKTVIQDYCWEPFSKKSILSYYQRRSGDSAALLRVLKGVAPDGAVAFCHSLSDKLLVTEPAARSGYKIIWLEHGPMIERLLWWKPLIRHYRQISASVSRIICVSQTTANNIALAGVEKSKLAVVYNGTPPVTVKERPTAAAKGAEVPRLLTTNRLVAEKGYEELFAALRQVAHKPWRMEIVADGPLRLTLEAACTKGELKNRVTFYGFKSSVAPYLAEADIFVNSTIYPAEGLPISNIEALAAGLPLITSSYGGAVETVEDGVSGFLVDPKNTNQLAGAIEKLLDDPKKRVVMGRAAWALWKERFSLQKMTDDTVKLLTDD